MDMKQMTIAYELLEQGIPKNEEKAVHCVHSVTFQLYSNCIDKGKSRVL